MKLRHIPFIIIVSLPLTSSECQPAADALGPCGVKTTVDGFKVLKSPSDTTLVQTGKSNKDCHVDVVIKCSWADPKRSSDTTEPPINISVSPMNVWVADWPLNKTRELAGDLPGAEYYRWVYTVSNGSKNITPAYAIIGAFLQLKSTALPGDSVVTVITMEYKEYSE